MTYRDLLHQLQDMATGVNSKQLDREILVLNLLDDEFEDITSLVTADSKSDDDPSNGRLYDGRLFFISKP